MIHTEVIDEVTVIRFDDGKANALGFEAIEGIEDALARAAVDSKAVVVLGRDGKFSAGFDLSVMTSGVDQARLLLGRGAEMALKVYLAPIPVVFGVSGHALAMGGILSVCPDYRVGARGPFKIGLNEVAIGMPVPKFGIELCRDRLSRRWFTRCVQHAHICSPDEALEAGFVDELVEPAAVESRAVEVAAHLAATVQPMPFQTTRTSIRAELASRLQAALPDDLALFDMVTP